MTRRRSVRALVVTSTVASFLGVAGGIAAAAFSSRTSTSATVSTAPDWIAPRASASVIAPTGGGSVGQLQAGDAYYVYAMVSDTGNPASGVDTATADVSSVTPGQTAAALVAGSFPLGPITYNYRSPALTSDAGLATATYAYTLTLTDVAGNLGTQTGLSVDVTAVPAGPTGVDIQTANGGSIPGQAEAGDRISFIFSTPMDPGSILPGWAGAPTPVTVSFANGGGGSGACGGSLSVQGVELGSVCLGDKYTSGNRDANGLMSMSGSVVTVLLTSAPPKATTVTTPTTMTWTPSAAATDMLGNPCSTATVTESGGSDVEF